jgi:hypothetical protein
MVPDPIPSVPVELVEALSSFSVPQAQAAEGKAALRQAQDGRFLFETMQIFAPLR